MTPTELRAQIDAKAASDADFAKLVDAGANGAIAQALPAVVTPRQYLVTYRGIRRVLGAHEGRIFVQSLRAFAALVASLPEDHQAYDELWWLNELLPDLDTGGDGIDIGDAETRTALRALAGPMAALLPSGPNITTAHCDALDAASSTSVPVSVDAVRAAMGV